MGFKAWETPRVDSQYDEQFGDFEHWHCQFGFTLDAAADHWNHLLPKYCTPRGMFFVPPPQEWEWRGLTLPADIGLPPLSASKRKLNDFDGLNPRAWQNEIVFCNPPYDHSLYKWVQLAWERHAKISVLLLPASVDTAWYHDFIMPAPAMKTWINPFAPDEVRFKRGRIRFNKRGVPGDAPRAGNMLAVFRR